jgi:hypothetical protein
MSPGLSFLKMGLELPLLGTSSLQYFFHIFSNAHYANGYLSLSYILLWVFDITLPKIQRRVILCRMDC